jgi:hypothetical protein
MLVMLAVGKKGKRRQYTQHHPLLSAKPSALRATAGDRPHQRLNWCAVGEPAARLHRGRKNRVREEVISAVESYCSSLRRLARSIRNRKINTAMNIRVLRKAMVSNTGHLLEGRAPPRRIDLPG